MAQTTLNKDGSPRKKGSGKTKGAGCFTKISWSQLQEYVGENTLIPVSRVWLRSLAPLLEQPTKEEGKSTKEPKQEIGELIAKPEPESNLDEDSKLIVAVTPPYSYSQDFDL